MAQITRTGTSTRRTILADVVPLDTPFIVQIFPVYACNFRCGFCIHSIEPSKRGYVADKKYMDFELYKKAIDDIKTFPRKIKMLRFAATGEPLLHKQIADMIKYAKDADIADSIEIVTNASLLSKELSDKLIDAGLDWLRISVEGLSSDKYKEICKADINFDEFVENICYFYQKRKNTKIYIKIIDCALQNEAEKQKFFNIFANICDKIAVESLYPAVDEIDYTKFGKNSFESTQNGNKLVDIKVCPQPFYLLQVNPEGNIVPCCSMETPVVLGNCIDETIPEIWRGQKYKSFQLKLLSGKKDCNKVCAKCQTYKFGTFKEDILDDNSDAIIKRLLNS